MSGTEGTENLSARTETSNIPPFASQPGDNTGSRPEAASAPLIVRWVAPDGSSRREFDFGTLAVAPPIQQGLAAAFARRTEPGAGPDTARSTREIYTVTRNFAEYLSTLPEPPTYLEQLTAEHIDGFQHHRAHERALGKTMGHLKAVLRHADGLHESTVSKLGEPNPKQTTPPQHHHPYSQAEFDRVAEAARNDLRTAAARIRRNRALLEQFRAAPTTPAVGRIDVLDYVDRHGYMPSPTPSSRPRHGRAATVEEKSKPPQYGTVSDCMTALHLTERETMSIAALLAATTGQEPQTITGLTADYRHEHRHIAPNQSFTLTDYRIPDWIKPPTDTKQLSAHQQLHTPFGIFALLVELTTRTREIRSSDRLLVGYRATTKYSPGRGLRVIQLPKVYPEWDDYHHLHADPPEHRTQPIPLKLSLRRLRLTYAEQHRKPAPRPAVQPTTRPIIPPAMQLPAPISTQFPDDNTAVLANRPIRQDLGTAVISRFGDDRWHLDAAIFEEDAPPTSLLFTAIPITLQRAAKHYIWQLINGDRPVSVHRVGRTRPSIRSVAVSWTHLKAFILWLDRHMITELAAVTPATLDAFARDLANSDIPRKRKCRQINEVRRLWAYRDQLPKAAQLPTRAPWANATTRELLGETATQPANRTTPIAKPTMQSLQRWSSRFIETFAPDILAAHAEFLFLSGRTVNPRRDDSLPTPSTDQVRYGLGDYLHRMRRTHGQLPGRTTTNGTTDIDYSHLGRILACAPQQLSRPRWAIQMLHQSGVPIADRAYLDTPITARLDNQPWHGPICYYDAKRLARHLSTACMITIAHMSGANPGEILNLRRDCLERDPSTGAWLMRGLYYKNAVDDMGDKLPTGVERPAPWTVAEPVAQAVAVLHNLHQHELLFPAVLQPPYRRKKRPQRQGSARTTFSAASDLQHLVDWINTYARARGLSGTPLDVQGLLALLRIRALEGRDAPSPSGHHD
ncbi:hypothetical protein ACFWPH_28385 [Nocardia sp. NPDC058499]|uniref:hypothetical protein n=1 Tax=Nocardia sp. NPDC058499 TaxID=3346530 RepID=UPI00366896E2